MREDRLPDAIDPLRPVTSRRSSWVGGPGFIFFLLLILIGAGGTLYLQATGRLDQLLARGGFVDLGTTPAPTPAGTADSGMPDLQPMPSFTSDTPSAPAKQLVLTPLSPQELLSARPAPRSLRLVPGEFDQPPVLRFARPALFLGPKPRIGIVVVGLGLNQGVTGAAIADLPPEITLSFSPYAPELAAWIDAAHAYGHEVMLDLPLEPLNYPQDDPGPLGLLTALNKSENLRRLDHLLELAAGITGVVTQSGDRFLADNAALRPILSELGQRGLGFLDTSGNAGALGVASKGLTDAPLRATTDMAIAQDESRHALAAQMDSVMVQARARKQALMVVHSYPLSIAALTSLAPAAKDRGLVLVPASTFLTRN